jgi:hypothetical protein
MGFKGIDSYKPTKLETQTVFFFLENKKKKKNKNNQQQSRIRKLSHKLQKAKKITITERARW